MPSLPPSMWAELFFDSTWNDVTADFRQTSPATVKRGLTGESAEKASPTAGSLTLNNRAHAYAPRNPTSDLFGKIGRNTPARWGYRVGSPWLDLDGVAGSKLTTPDSASLAVTDLDLRIDMVMEDWTPTAVNIAGRYVTTGDNRSWALVIGTSGLEFLWSPDGTLASRISEFSTELLQGYNGQRLTLRITLDVDNGAGGYELRFYTGRTVDDEEWVLLGDPVVGAATTSVFDGAAGIELGDIAGLTGSAVNGKIFAFKLLSGIGAAGLVAASMVTSDAGVGASSFTSGGAVWSVEGSADLSNKHIRMSGEVPEWPSVRDKSGNDTSVTIAPTDVTRRMDAGNKPQDSALLRFIRANDPLECYPLTDGELSTEGTPLKSGQNMKPSITFGAQQPSWGKGQLNAWTENVVTPVLGTDGTMRGQVASASSADSGWSVDFFFSGVLDGSLDLTLADAGAGTDADNRIGFTVEVDQDNDRIRLFITSAGETSSSVTLLSTVSSPTVFDNAVHHVRVEATPNAPNTDWELYVDGVSVASGSHGVVVRRLLFVRPGWFMNAATQGVPSFGYVTYWDTAGPTAASMWTAATGFPGERAGARIERLASEAGYTATVAGVVSQQELMGVQTLGKTLAVLNAANKTNFGYLLGARDRAEIIHRGHSTLWNQPPGLTLDFSAGLIDDYRYRDDDLLTENDVSVQREFGQVPSQQVLESGALSVQDPPDGVGRYDKQYEYSLSVDAQAADVASMLLNLGTYDGIRYPQITLNLANERVFQMIDDVLRMDVGDKIRLTNVPAEHGPDDVDVLVAGYTEEAGPGAWRISFVCVPAQPWTAMVVDRDAYDRLDTASCVLNGAMTATSSIANVVTAVGSTRWMDSATFPSEFPFDVRTDGEVMRVTSCAGTALSQTFGVVRGINGVQTAHASGEDIRLASPSYLAL